MIEPYHIFYIFFLGLGVGLLGRHLYEKYKNFSKKEQSEIPVSKPPSEIAKIYKIAEALDDFYSNTAHPKDLLESSEFLRAVKMLNQSDKFSLDALFDYYTGENMLIACMALEALKRRELDDIFIERLLDNVAERFVWPLYFLIQILKKQSRQPVVGRLLLNAQEWWHETKMLTQFCNDLINTRLEKGEKISFYDKHRTIKGEQIDNIQKFLQTLLADPIKPLLQELEQLQKTQLDTSFLNSIGRVLSSEDDQDPIYAHQKLEKDLQQVEEALFEEPTHSILLVGESGVGKSVLIRSLAKRIHKRRWRIFEAGATDVLAGQVYIGELEKRIQLMIQNLDKRRQVIWYAPNFHELVYAGQHRYSPTGVLDMLLPFVENGQIKIIGETQPAGYERLMRDRKRINTIFEAIRVQPLDKETTFEIAHHWAAQYQQVASKKPFMNEKTLIEAQHLAQQFLNVKNSPGNLLNFLKLTQRRSMLEGTKKWQIEIDDLYGTLSHLTGLPRNILDDRLGLDLKALRKLFEKRVLGQPEAVNCLVERVAMIKAGLNDPTRPLGVFLFAGPTGSGKTEIAKTLSEFLFGSEERMIRLDMSEFNSIDAINRILGDRTEFVTSTSSLVSQIREQPFSVVLLDEFEKAHQNIWDLFLQVFDDGRLTDRKGNTVDFRHCIFILTSNLGAVIHAGASIGFKSDSSAFSHTRVEKAIATTFRREFVNRLDRIVIFRPLSRSIMREILYNELNNALLRRGLRNREWAVEWEDSAVEFLLTKGFTADLGARPLKRAIERYVLSPLAITIVNHQFPEGDQFLFVRSNGQQINVEFIDPDIPDTEGVEPALTDKAGEADGINLKKLILETRGTHLEIQSLQRIYEELKARTLSEIWKKSKQRALTQTSAPGFWESPQRFAVLGEVEYMDRIESGLETAGSLLKRLVGDEPESRTFFSRELIARLAQQLYLINEAFENFLNKTPKDAFLKIEVNPNSAKTAEKVKKFARQLNHMYQQWAKKRRMQFEVLVVEDSPGMAPYSAMLAISGFGAYSILQSERGLHVLETPKERKPVQRLNVRIRVVPQAETPLADKESLLDQAIAAFAQEGEGTSTIVRRYQNEPTPLVRDVLHKWRTGRLDRVLDGDFDLFR